MQLAVADSKRILTAAGYYKGPIDESNDPKYALAVEKILSRHEGKLPTNRSSWGLARSAIAAVQIILAAAGFTPGVADGLYGNNTHGAFVEWNHEQTTGTPLVLPRKPIVTPEGRGLKDTPLQRDCGTYYGRTEKEIKSHLVVVEPPYTMRLDYDLKTRARTIRLHAKAAPSAEQALRMALNEYGYERLKTLGLDRYAGAYFWRKMRGGKSLSMHAYGCAIDFYAEPNGLNTRCPDALFCGAEYKAWFDIWEACGWISLGRVIGRDWMHVQRARLS